MRSSSLWEGGSILGSLLGAFVLSLTVVSVVAIGILLAFGTVIVILQALAPQERSRNAATLVVTARARAAHAGGN